MRKKHFVVHLTIMTTVFLFVASFAAMAASVPRITTDELKSHIGEEGYIVLDVRASRDWNESTEKIYGAERVAAGSVNQWADNYAGSYF